MNKSIWTNDTEQFDDEEIRSSLREREYEENEITDALIFDEKCELTQSYLEDEIENLNKTLAGRVLCISDLGLWDGRHYGYRIMDNNLNACLRAFEGNICSCYFDGKNIVAKDTHHDGTNFYTFREIKEDKNINILLAKLYNGTATGRDIATYTRSIAPYVCDVYGWKYPYRRAKQAA